MSAAPPFPPNLATLIETYKKRYGEAWYPSIDTMLLLDVLGYRLPESEGQSSEAITSTETSELPARQSGSPEVDPSGERPKDLRCELVFKGKDCKYTGPVQTCDKTYESCRNMFNVTNFRGMPVSLPPEERGLPRVTIQIPMPPVKPPRKDDL